MRHKASFGLFSYWSRARGDRPAPLRGDISPADIQPFLPAIFIAERGDTGHFVFRLAGTGACTLFGRELRRTSLSELWHGEQTETMRNLIEAVATGDGCPRLLEGNGESHGGRPLPVEVLLLPLQAPGNAAECILGAINALDQPLWLDTDPLHHFQSMNVRILDQSDADGIGNQSALAGNSRHAAIFRSRGNGTDLPRVNRLTLIENGNSD